MTIEPSTSISLYAAENVVGLFTVTGNDSCVKKYAKYAACSASFALLLVITTIEGIARAALAIVAKLFTFFVPQQCAKTLDEKVLFLANTAHGNFYIIFKTINAAFKAVFFNDHVSNAIEIFSTIHFNGFTNLNDN